MKNYSIVQSTPLANAAAAITDLIGKVNGVLAGNHGLKLVGDPDVVRNEANNYIAFQACAEND